MSELGPLPDSLEEAPRKGAPIERLRAAWSRR